MRSGQVFTLLLLAGLTWGVADRNPVAFEPVSQPGFALENGDMNGDGASDISDGAYLLGGLYRSGPEPVAACGEMGEGAGAAGNPNPRVVPVHPYGMSYGEWGAAWWQWGLGVPAAGNPLTDTTGEFCDAGQSGPVWFLAGTFGEPHVVARDCTAPTGKSFFFPVLKSFCAAEGKEDEMRECARGFLEPATGLDVTVDGVELRDLEDYRADSPGFVLTLTQLRQLSRNLINFANFRGCHRRKSSGLAAASTVAVRNRRVVPTYRVDPFVFGWDNERRSVERCTCAIGRFAKAERATRTADSCARCAKGGRFARKPSRISVSSTPKVARRHRLLRSISLAGVPTSSSYSRIAVRWMQCAST
jgi:hypothetical protein